MKKRTKTNYPGVYYRTARRIGGKGTERVYYIVFKKDGRMREEKVGRQFADGITPARAAGIRAERIEGKRLSRKEIREQEKARRVAEQARWTINRLWEEYMSGRAATKTLIVDEGRYKKYLKPAFGHKEPKDLLVLDVDRLKFRLLKIKSPQTVKHVLSLLERIANFGRKRSLCEGVPFQIQKPRVDNLRTEDLSSGQLRGLLDAIERDQNIQARNLMKLALHTGMRRGELFKLKWDHIDFHRGFISICDPKGGPDQKIPLNEPAREILLSHPKTESPYVFPGRNGNRRVTISQAVNRIKARSGLPKDFRPLHGLRHAYASMLASSGKVDMYTLQKLLTHKSPVMTQRYAHLRDEALKRAADIAGDLIEQAVNGKGQDKVAHLEKRKE